MQTRGKPTRLLLVFQRTPLLTMTRSLAAECERGGGAGFDTLAGDSAESVLHRTLKGDADADIEVAGGPA